MMTLPHKLRQFWQIIPDAYSHLAPQFWAEEDRRNRYRAQFIGISGVILMLGFIFVDLLRGPISFVSPTTISLILLISSTILAFNQLPPIRKIPIYPLYSVALSLSILGACLAGVFIKEIVQLVISFFLIGIALLLVPGFTNWFLATVLIFSLSHVVAFRLILPDASQLAFTQVYFIFLISPIILALITRMGVKQRWEVFLNQQMIQEVNVRLQEQKMALEEANNLLEKRNEELDAFSHTVAHDLKNPLTIVVGYAEVVRDDMLEAEDFRWLEYINQVISAGRRGNVIIQELLLLAAVRKEDIELEPLDMGVIVAQALERLSHHIETNGVEVVQPSQWPVVTGYPGWVEEVWVNYISNAIKYGGRPCRVILTAEPRPEGWIRFGVQDNGKGLTPEAQALLFTEFTRLDKIRAKGHGLGLSIVQRIMEKLNGRTGIQSEVGQGSTFYFELPA
jgi:signal transduction histidine kinase